MNSINHKLQAHIDGIAASKSNADIKANAIVALSSLGFDQWIYGAESRENLLGYATLASGQTWKWLLVYMGKGYLNIDPVVRHCKENREPLLWDSAEESKCKDPRIKAFWKDVSRNGYGSGVSVPLRSSGGLNGLISVVSHRPLIETTVVFSEHLEGVRMIGKAMHIGVEQLMTR